MGAGTAAPGCAAGYVDADVEAGAGFVDVGDAVVCAGADGADRALIGAFVCNGMPDISNCMIRYQVVGFLVQVSAESECC